MSTPCTTCGQPLDGGHERCPICGVLASPPADETASVAGPDPTLVVDAPWAIPIREPRTASTPEPGPGRGRTAGLALLAVVALAVVAVAGSRLLDGDDAGTASGRTEPADSDETAGIDVDAVRAEATTTTVTSETTVAPTTTETSAPASTITTVVPATTLAPATTTTTPTARTGPNGTGSVPALSTGFRGWLAQLTSVPYGAGTDGLAEEWERLRRAVPGAVAARSDDWSAFRDGFWVMVDPGPFASADDVRAFCARAGFDGDGECLPRELRG